MQVVFLWWSVSCQISRLEARYGRLVQRSVSCSAVKSTTALHLAWCDCLFALEENCQDSQVMSSLPKSSHIYDINIFTVLTASQMTVLQCTVRLFWTYLNYQTCASAPSDQGASWPVGETVAQCLRNRRNLSLSINIYIIYIIYYINIYLYITIYY